MKKVNRKKVDPGKATGHNRRDNAPSEGEHRRDWEQKAGDGDRERKLRGDDSEHLTNKDATGKRLKRPRPRPT